MTNPARGICPDCGTPLPSDPATDGICPRCLMSLAFATSEPDELRTWLRDAEEPEGERVLGNRYRIRSLLGRGGMGEVWRAFDLKLGVDVALKALHAGFLARDDAEEFLRREVRSAREVVSPNVCRIFDLIIEDGQELVSMEYIDGTTLADVLHTRGPLDLQEASEIAAQFLAGLESIHQAGLVHRDFKPENVMVTRSGRVVVMDFGVAKGVAESRGGTIAGTPAYMAPEQARGAAVDARADVFSAGVVLAEMVALEAGQPRQQLWESLREVPPKLPETPWAPVLNQALAWEPEARFDSARSLARALEEVHLELPGFDEVRPYPGLAAFTEADTDYFFGRELEVEALWKKLKRPHLMALIGASGAGKSSFLRAGLLPTLPERWGVVACTPGSRPFQTLAQTLVPFFAGDHDATRQLMQFEDADVVVSLMSRWRARWENALIIVDQFEELFTQNRSEVQEAFAELVGRLVLEADVHVLLSMRDDFLVHCQSHEALAPIFNDLTPLGTLSESALRRAVVQPALACGYRFEDDAMVDEMIAEVRDERGALPMLAFAAARLWEKRDRDKGLLTREAYEWIGRVGGALAHHAEATLEHIGAAKAPIVRELFRNLVTAQGTRVGRDIEDLVSVFGAAEEKEHARAILQTLIDARLLTSYESVDGGARRVEIIHESLITRWPRLVRWRAQDEDGAHLRDQLRQAARLWQEREQSDDMLWTGTAFRELELWRERYPGKLTETEEAFSRAMVARAQRQRRRRRLAMASVIGVLSLGLAVVVGLWRQAREEALRAEAAEILALGRVRLDDYPTAALAYAIASLEKKDSPEARRFAVETLAHEGAAFVVPTASNNVAFNRDGRWLATSAVGSGLHLWSRGGGEPVFLGSWEGARFDPSDDHIEVGDADALYALSVPDGEEVHRIDDDDPAHSLRRIGSRLFTFTTDGDHVRSVSIEDGGEPIGELEWDDENAPSRRIEPSDSGEWLGFDRERKIYALAVEDLAAPPQLLGEHPDDVVWITFETGAERLLSSDRSGEVRIWSREEGPWGLERTVQSEIGIAQWDMDASGAILAGTAVRPAGTSTDVASVWDLHGPPDAGPRVFRNGDAVRTYELAVARDGRWLAVAHDSGGTLLWPLDRRRSWTFRETRLPRIGVQFTQDGKWLASSSSGDRRLLLWPLSADVAPERRVLLEGIGLGVRIAMHPDEQHLLAGSLWDGRAMMVPLDGGRRESSRGIPSRGFNPSPSPRMAVSLPRPRDMVPKEALSKCGTWRREACAPFEFGKKPAGGTRAWKASCGTSPSRPRGSFSPRASLACVCGISKTRRACFCTPVWKERSTRSPRAPRTGSCSCESTLRRTGLLSAITISDRERLERSRPMETPSARPCSMLPVRSS